MIIPFMATGVRQYTVLDSGTDGNILYSTTNATWSTIRDAATGTGTNTSSFTASITAGNTSNRWDLIRRGFIRFDVSSVPSTGIVTLAVLRVLTGTLTTVLTGPVDFDIVSSSNTFSTASYNDFGTTPYASQALASTEDSTWYSLTLNAAGINGIDSARGSGIWVAGVRIDSDTDNNPPTWGSGESTHVPFTDAELILHIQGG